MKRLAIVIMAAALIVGFAGASHAKEEIRAAGATIIQVVVDRLAKPFSERHPGITIKTAGGGSSVAITSAGEGAVEIGMPARPLTPAEARIFPKMQLFTFAKDGVAVIVHPTNPVKGLTMAQLRDIFTGKITDWGAVGGKGPITVVSRERGSGTRVAFEEAVLAKDKLGKARVAGSTGEVRKIVSADPTTIGYVVIGSVDASVRSLTLDGRVPTIDNVRAGAYTLVTPFYLATAGEPKGAVKTFIDWVLSPEGQALVEKERLVPVKATK